jgi:hypothetical protein
MMFSSNFFVNAKKNKEAQVGIARRDGKLVAEVHLGPVTGDKVVLNSEDWSQLLENVDSFMAFFKGTRKHHHMQLINDHFLTYVYTRSSYGKQIVTFSQIRRNSEVAKYPTAAYFSPDSFSALASTSPLINHQLEHAASLCDPLHSTIIPAIAAKTFICGGSTKDTCPEALLKIDRKSPEFYVANIDAFINKRLVLEIVLSHADLVWEYIFMNELSD